MSHHDGSPAHNVPVKVNHLPEPVIVSLGTARVTANMPKMDMLALTVRTPPMPGRTIGSRDQTETKSANRHITRGQERVMTNTLIKELRSNKLKRAMT